MSVSRDARLLCSGAVVSAVARRVLSSAGLRRSITLTARVAKVTRRSEQLR